MCVCVCVCESVSVSVSASVRVSEITVFQCFIKILFASYAAGSSLCSTNTGDDAGLLITAVQDGRRYGSRSHTPPCCRKVCSHCLIDTFRPIKPKVILFY